MQIKIDFAYLVEISDLISPSINFPSGGIFTICIVVHNEISKKDLGKPSKYTRRILGKSNLMPIYLHSCGGRTTDCRTMPIMHLLGPADRSMRWLIGGIECVHIDQLNGLAESPCLFALLRVCSSGLAERIVGSPISACWHTNDQGLFVSMRLCLNIRFNYVCGSVRFVSQFRLKC